MELDYNVIGERLRKARLEKNYTQEYLAERMNVSVAFLSRIERGSSHINLKRLTEICKLLEITEGEVLNGCVANPESYLISEFNLLFKGCPPEKLKLIYNIAKLIIKDGTDKNNR